MAAEIMLRREVTSWKVGRMDVRSFLKVVSQISEGRWLVGSEGLAARKDSETVAMIAVKWRMLFASRTVSAIRWHIRVPASGGKR
jgi:hypothetical protein